MRLLLIILVAFIKIYCSSFWKNFGFKPCNADAMYSSLTSFVVVITIHQPIFRHYWILVPCLVLTEYLSCSMFDCLFQNSWGLVTPRTISITITILASTATGDDNVQLCFLLLSMLMLFEKLWLWLSLQLSSLVWRPFTITIEEFEENLAKWRRQLKWLAHYFLWYLEKWFKSNTMPTGHTGYVYNWNNDILIFCDLYFGNDNLSFRWTC